MARLIRKIIYFIFYIIVILFFLTPFIWMIIVSINSNQFFLNTGTDNFTLKNYLYIFEKVPVFKYVLNSLFVCTMCVLGTIISSLLSAYGFSRIQWKYRNKIFNVLLLGMFLPPFITMIPIFIGWSKLGVVNSFLPLIVPSWFGGSISNIYIMRQFLIKFPSEYDEAAKLEGASHFQILKYIIIPLSRPVVAVCAILSFISNWNELIEPLIYLNDQSKYTLMLGMQVFNSGNLARWNILMSACGILTYPLIIIFIIFQKQIYKGVTSLY